MKSMLRMLSILVVGVALYAATAGPASAQAIIRAVYRVSLTDPATGNVYYSDRQSIRSWSSEDRCQNEMATFSGFHTRALKDLNITNTSGTPLEVKMDSMYCVTIRE